MHEGGLVAEDESIRKTRRTKRRVCRTVASLLGTVVRRFLGDLHIVHMGFAHAGRGDFHELGFFVHVVNRGAAAVTHDWRTPPAIW